MDDLKESPTFKAAVLEDSKTVSKCEITALENINDELREVFRQLKRHGADARNAARIAEILQKAQFREYFILEKIQYLQTAMQKASKQFDIAKFMAPMEDYIKAFELALSRVVVSIGRNDKNSALEQVRKAILINQLIERQLEKLISYDQQLLRSMT